MLFADCINIEITCNNVITVSLLYTDSHSVMTCVGSPVWSFILRDRGLTRHVRMGTYELDCLVVNIRSHNNISDVVSKHWSYGSVKDLLKPIFNTVGNTAKLFVDDSPDCLDEFFFDTNQEEKKRKSPYRPDLDLLSLNNLDTNAGEADNPSTLAS